MDEEQKGIVLMPAPEKRKQSVTFFWVLGKDLAGLAWLSVAFKKHWKCGDCVKVTMEKVEG